MLAPVPGGSSGGKKKRRAAQGWLSASGDADEEIKNLKNIVFTIWV